MRYLGVFGVENGFKKERRDGDRRLANQNRHGHERQNKNHECQASSKTAGQIGLPSDRKWAQSAESEFRIAGPPRCTEGSTVQSSRAEIRAGGSNQETILCARGLIEREMCPPSSCPAGAGSARSQRARPMPRAQWINQEILHRHTGINQRRTSGTAAMGYRT